MKASKTLKVMLLGFTLFSSLRTYADARAAGATNTTSAMTNTTPVVTPTPTDQTMRDQMSQTANQQGQASQVGQYVSMGLAGWAGYEAAKENYGYAAILGVASMLANHAANHNNDMSSANNNFVCANTAGGCPTTPSPTATPISPNVTSTGNGDGMGSSNTDSLKPLIDKGFKVDSKKLTVTTPEGKTFGPATLSSPSAMAAAGLSASDFGKLKDITKKLEKEGQTKSAEGILGDSPEGGGSKSSGAIGDSFPQNGQQSSGREKLGINRDPAQVAGLKTNLNGEPIGVAADSIFGIVDRRYQLHKDKGSFITP